MKIQDVATFILTVIFQTLVIVFFVNLLGVWPGALTWTLINVSLHTVLTARS